MVSYYHVIVDFSQLALATVWGSPLHAWLATVGRIVCARCPKKRYPYEARSMDNHILLPQYSQKLLHVQQCGLKYI